MHATRQALLRCSIRTSAFNSGRCRHKVHFQRGALYTDDVPIFAGCLTGQKGWPTVAVDECPVPRIAAALAHSVLEVVSVDDDGVRPRHFCRVAEEGTLTPFTGFNRAKATLLELACCRAKNIGAEIAYLTIEIEKTSGPDEKEA